MEQHFAYLLETINGDRATDKTQSVCKHCKRIVAYATANVSTLQ